jgi:hypothetical protein
MKTVNDPLFLGLDANRTISEQTEAHCERHLPPISSILFGKEIALIPVRNNPFE